jgi:hypothetical protein
MPNESEIDSPETPEKVCTLEDLQQKVCILTQEVCTLKIAIQILVEAVTLQLTTNQEMKGADFSVKSCDIINIINKFKLIKEYNILSELLGSYEADFSALQTFTKVVSRKTRVRTFQKFAPDSTEYILAEGLLNLIKKHKPDYRTPNLQEWTLVIDRMIRRDKRDPETIAKVIEWCQQDLFWRRNILSTNKLRAQFDRLEMEMDSTDLESDEPEILDIAERLYRLFRDRFVGSKKKFTANSSKEQNKFIKAAKKLRSFCKKRDVIPKDYEELLIDALDSTYKQQNRLVYTSSICSEATWTTVFPQYLNERVIG